MPRWVTLASLLIFANMSHILSNVYSAMPACLSLQQCCCPCCNVVVAIVKLVLLSLLQRQHHHCHCAGIFAVVLPLLWCVCHPRADSVVWLSHTSSVWPWSVNVVLQEAMMTIILCLLYLREQRWWLIATSALDPAATTNIFHWCGSTTLTIAKAQSTSNNIDRDARTTTSMKQQSFFFIKALQGATTVK